MIVKGEFEFPVQWPNIIFKDIDITISPIVKKLDPLSMTIDVNVTFTVKGDGVSGDFEPEINPVPIKNLHYDSDSLTQRVIDRLNDFKIKK